jgi:hypothetical protein
MGQNHFLFRRVFTNGIPSPVQFRDYLDAFLFGTHFNETHLEISLSSRIVQHTSKYPAMHCNLGVYSGSKIAPKITFLVLTVSNYYCFETLGICCVIFPG